MTQVIEKPIKGQEIALKGSKISNTEPTRQKVYSFLKRRENPEYDKGIVRLPFESCLNTTNGTKKGGQKQVNNSQKEVHVKTTPKWYTDLLMCELDQVSGELFPKEIYTSDDFKCSNGKKIKALDRFCAKYQPLYRLRRVSLFFMTFTRANHAKLRWGIMCKLVVKYFKRLGINVRGQIWTAEVSDSFHWHYHLCIATDRVNWKDSGIPPSLKFENLWGQRTEIDFVKKNVRHYMAKYFAKCNYRVIGFRSYGISRKLK